MAKFNIINTNTLSYQVSVQVEIQEVEKFKKILKFLNIAKYTDYETFYNMTNFDIQFDNKKQKKQLYELVDILIN